MATELPSSYKRLPGKSQRFQNIATGETISRREFNKRTGRLSFEELAKVNKQANPIQQLLRPARGRTSAVKVAPDIRDAVIEARSVIKETTAAEKRAALEKQKRQKQLKKEAEAEARKLRRIEREKNKLYRRQIPKLSLLKPGTLGFRVRFTSYADYAKMMKELIALKPNVFGVSLGWAFIDERTGKKGAMMVTTLQGISERDTMDEDEFNDLYEPIIEEKSYAIFLYYFAHVAVTKAYAKENAIRNGKKWKDK